MVFAFKACGLADPGHQEEPMQGEKHIPARRQFKGTERSWLCERLLEERPPADNLLQFSPYILFAVVISSWAAAAFFF